MSEVTNLILSFSILENEVSRKEEIELFSNNGRGFRLSSADYGFGQRTDIKSRERWYAGSKLLETPLFVGAYNHLDIEGLIEHLKSLDWREPENVQLMIQGQHENKFKMIEII